MTFNDLFVKKSLGKKGVDLSLNINLLTKNDDRQNIFCMEMKKAYADTFIKHLSQKYLTVYKCIDYLKNRYMTLSDGLMTEFYYFAKANLKTKMSLLDYYEKYNLDHNIIVDHLYYSLSFNLEIGGSFSGHIYLDEALDPNLIEVNGEQFICFHTSGNDFKFNLKDANFLDSVEISFVEII